MKLLLSSITLLILLFPSVSRALHLSLPARVYQGDLIVGKVEPVGTVLLKGKKLAVSSRGYFVIGVPRLQKTDFLITAMHRKKKISKTVMVMAYQWKIQRIDGLPKHQVNPPPKALKRIKKDNKKVREIQQAGVFPVPLFLRGGFIAPVKGTITGAYGSQRILNGQSRSPHSGLDIAAAKGTPVVSPANGIVRLVAKKFVFNGQYAHDRPWTGPGVNFHPP